MRKPLFRISCLALAMASALSCSVYTKPQKVEDYLHYVKYEKYDFKGLAKTANFLFGGKGKMPSAACSAIRKDSLFGRNFDWLYDEMPEFIIVTDSTSSRYASIGIAAPISVMKDKQVGSLWGSIILNHLPIFTVDGINEKGVACCINVTPQGDCGYTSGTNPGKPRMYAAIFVRYVLDNASSAAEAVSFLEDFDIYTSTAFGLSEDYHFLIADSASTYVVEFADNKEVVLDSEHIITNYNLCAGKTPHAMGIERMDILRNGEEDAVGKEGLYDLLRSVWFSNAYDDEESPLWLSELCYVNNPYGLTVEDIRTDTLKCKEAFFKEREKYLNRDRKKPEIWQTVHTSIYNLQDRTLTIYPQESQRMYIYKLSDHTEP